MSDIHGEKKRKATRTHENFTEMKEKHSLNIYKQIISFSTELDYYTFEISIFHRSPVTDVLNREFFRLF